MNAPSGVNLRLSLAAAAVLAAWTPALTPAWAAEEDEEIARLTRPDSSIEAGIGVVSDDNTRFGQYTGMTEKGAYPLLDLRMRKRSADGVWFNATGRNLGLENRDLRLEYSRQGDWGAFVEYGQTPRYSPYTVMTRLTGYDSGQQTVNGAPVASPLELKTERRTLNLGLDKILGGSFDVQVRVRDEEKEGRRLYGRTGTDFLVDPIDYKTQLFEASAGYTGERLQLTGGYFGTNFVNSKPRLDVAGGTGTGFSPIALPPGNQSHQLNFGGGYGITPTTRATFKLARTVQTQTDAFIDATTTNRTNLGGRIDSTFAQIGLTSRPLPGLSLLGNLRYDNRNDRTPVVDYFNVTATTTATGENEPRSLRTRAGKAEATYQLPMGFRVTGGVEQEDRWRNTSAVRVVSYRERTDETSYRIELGRAMSETLNGRLGYISSRRGGSEWQTTTQSNGTNGSNLLHPLHLADRDRDKLRGALGWAATEQLDVNFLADYSRDDYGGRTLGLKNGTARHYSVDAALRLSDAWQLTAWYSRDDTRAHMESCENAAASNTGNLGACPSTTFDPRWEATLRNVGNALGAGVRGKPTGVLEVGADLAWSQDRGEFRQQPMPFGTAAQVPGQPITPVPDSHYLRTTFKLFARYALTKTSGVRLQYVVDRFKTDDWTWTSWTYADGTQVLPNPSQRVQFVGLSGYLQF